MTEQTPTHPKGRLFSSIPAGNGLASHDAEGATWRGWILGLLLVALLCLVIPYADFVLRGTQLSNALFPASSIFYIFALILGINIALAMLKRSLGLTRQDLILVFCMTMVVNGIPGNGFWSIWSSMVTGGQFFARPENRWAELVLPHIPSAWLVHDTENVRPIEWYYTGLPPGESIPWSPWVKPYLIWCVPLVLMFVSFFALSGMLRKNWSEQQRLAFPLAQLPLEMTSGLSQKGGVPFLRKHAAWWGIGLAFGLASWNALADYYPGFPQIPMGGRLDEYLTEPPFNALRPLQFTISLAVIGLTYLLSLEVAFSLWFFFIVWKVLAFFIVRTTSLGTDTWYFFQLGGHSGMFTDQGSGALFMLALGCLWMARRELKDSFLRAIGRLPEEEDSNDFSARTLWLALTASLVGIVGWLVWSGIDLVWALSMLALLYLIYIGITRLYCEGGIFRIEIFEFPIDILRFTATPAVLGSDQFVKLTMWDRMTVANWFRIPFLPNIMNSLHLATEAGLRRMTVMKAMAVAVLLSLVVSFGSFLFTVYSTPGGANTMGGRVWRMGQFDYRIMADVSRRVESHERKVEEAAAEGRTLSDAEQNLASERDWTRIAWMAVGGVVMSALVTLRTYFTWCPHPIGYIMWMGPGPIHWLFGSFFLGWAIKAGVMKYGGNRVYLRARTFFIGLIVGEALAAVIWKIVAASQGHVDAMVMFQ